MTRSLRKLLKPPKILIGEIFEIFMEISNQLKDRLSNTEEREMKMILVVSAVGCVEGGNKEGKSLL